MGRRELEPNPFLDDCHLFLLVAVQQINVLLKYILLRFIAIFNSFSFL